MTTFIFRRIVQALFVLVIIMLLVFIVVRLLPGDPILIYMTQQDVQTLTLDQLNAVRAALGLAKPLAVQFGKWVGGVLRGDFGMSLFYHQKVTTLVGQRLQATLMELLECKRILDNVALRLQNETGAHVVVIGYASSGKSARSRRLAERRAAARAENTKKYLVSKGISGDRVETRTGTPKSGASLKQKKPIEIIWVPEGATF